MKVKTSKRVSLRTINTVMLRCSVMVYAAKIIYLSVTYFTMTQYKKEWW